MYEQKISSCQNEIHISTWHKQDVLAGKGEVHFKKQRFVSKAQMSTYTFVIILTALGREPEYTSVWIMERLELPGVGVRDMSGKYDAHLGCKHVVGGGSISIAWKAICVHREEKKVI